MFNSYEELMAAVEDRRKSVLTLEVDMGGEYSQEHEDAKRDLKAAQAMRTLSGNQDFLGDNLDALQARVEATRPQSNPVWIRFSRMSLGEWSALTKTQGLSPIDQYERVLPQTFVGVYGQDPDAGEDVEPLSTDPELLSSRSDRGILTGAMMLQVVQAFMAWQNSGGEVTIHPTRSGQG